MYTRPLLFLKYDLKRLHSDHKLYENDLILVTRAAKKQLLRIQPIYQTPLRLVLLASNAYSKPLFVRVNKTNNHKGSYFTQTF